jgi:hypothetical protein
VNRAHIDADFGLPSCRLQVRSIITSAIRVQYREKLRPLPSSTSQNPTHNINRFDPMSQTPASNDDKQPKSPDSWDEYNAWDLDALALLPTLPQEIQDRIFECCDITSLAVLCRLSKHWKKRMTPLLWEKVDFVETFDDNEIEVVERSRKFFVLCDKLMAEEPARWNTLSPLVRKLGFGRVHGINIVHKEWDFDDYPYFDFPEEGMPMKRNIFDIVAQFTNLNSLSVYVKNWWGYSGVKHSGAALTQAMANLKSLKIGGQMPPDVLSGLLANPEGMEHLSLINLHATPGQDDGPDAVGIPRRVESRFSSLKTLHLVKLADLHGDLSGEDSSDEDDEDDERDRHYDSGMSWAFPRDSEAMVFRQWASLLAHSSKTLTNVILENRYLTSHLPHEVTEKPINPGVTHPVTFGAHSTQKSHETLFPVFDEKNMWPNLKTLTLIGMGSEQCVSQAFNHLEAQVQIEQRLATIEKMEGDCTPKQITTPIEFSDKATWEWHVLKTKLDEQLTKNEEQLDDVLDSLQSDLE